MYIVIHSQAVSLYCKPSDWLDIGDAPSQDRNPPILRQADDIAYDSTSAQ